MPRTEVMGLLSERRAWRVLNQSLATVIRLLDAGVMTAFGRYYEK